MTLDVLRRTFAAFNEDKAMRLAAAIAYSTIFSLAPLFIVMIAILGFLIGLQHGGHGHRAAEDALLAPVAQSVGPDTADALRGMISASFQKPRASLFAQILGWATFLFGASTLFASLQDALNAVWHIERTKGGWKQVARERLASFGMLAVVGCLLLASVLAAIAASTFGRGFLDGVALAHDARATAIIGRTLAFCVAVVVFASIFKVLPGVKLAWRDVFAGAFVTACLFTIGEVALGAYLGWSGAHSAYGAAGSILVGLLWIYYTATIILLGAEFTKVRTGAVATTAPCVVRRYRDLPKGADPRVDD